MDIVYIVLHFRDSRITARCLDSICREITKNDHVVVIDASHDFETSTSVHKAIRIINTRQLNPGFARSMNYGASVAQNLQPDIYCFVNNDTILETGFRKNTVRAFEAGGRQVAAVGPKIVYMERPDKIWSAGGYVSHIKMKSQLRRYGRSSSVSGFLSVDFLSGCVISIDASTFDEIGGWSEAYLFGGEEWELSRRLRNQGKVLLLCGDASVKHEADYWAGHGKSHSFNDLRFVLNSYINRIVYADRNVSRIRAAIFRTYLAVYILLIVPFRWKQVGDAKAVLKKMCYARAIARHILFRERNKYVTWSELSDFVSRVTNA